MPNNLQKIDFYKNVENLQICHIQIASKDSEIFEYAVEQIRDHVGHIYSEYMTQAAKLISDELEQQGTIDPNLAKRIISDNILIKEIAIRPDLQQGTASKLGTNLRKEAANLKSKIDFGH